LTIKPIKCICSTNLNINTKMDDRSTIKINNDTMEKLRYLKSLLVVKGRKKETYTDIIDRLVMAELEIVEGLENKKINKKK